MSRRKSSKSINLPFELPSNFDEWVAKAIFIGKIALTSLIVSVFGSVVYYQRCSNGIW